MDDDLEDLSRRLVRDPFDTDTRRTYAERLLQTGRLEDALEQWLVLGRQLPGKAVPAIGAAVCAARLGRPEQAETLLAAARACSDFSASEPLLAQAAPVEAQAGGGLRVIDGGKKDVGAPVTAISTKAGTRFIDVVGMQELKKLLRVRIIEPFLNPGLFQKFRRTAGGGVLLYGPPGCGKTLIARAIAGECKATFINVGIAEIMSMWIGESERNLAALFEKARAERPSVLFFDELDALAFARSKAQSEHTRRLVNEFLSQLDGLTAHNEQILVLAATNMPWDVDSAMKRPGRFDRQIFVPPPDGEARSEMFRVKLHGTPIAVLDFAALARHSEHFSGADIDGVINRAKDELLAEIVESGEERPLTQADLLAAAAQSEPSTHDWLKTARNLVKFGGRDRSYKDVEKYLKQAGLD